MVDRESGLPGSGMRVKSGDHGGDKAILVTLCLPHLPFHPSCLLGYGAAVLAQRYEVTVIDFNVELHFKNGGKLKSILDAVDKARFLSDGLFLDPFYAEVETQIDHLYATVPWEQYPVVYVTHPTWYPMAPTEAVLRLARAIRWVSPETAIFFFGRSLGTWTNVELLRKNGVQAVHLNDLFATEATAEPVRYDGLPTPVYGNREKYLFDLLPFMLKHGCPWARCRFCSFCRGGNSGYLERSAKAAVRELEVLIDRYDPTVLVCRDNALNGGNLIEFCGYLEKLHKPWCGEARGDLSGKEVEALSKAGCRLIFVGLESGSDGTLRAIDKGVTVKHMSNCIKMLHSNGIYPVPSLIVGAPGEGRADFEESIQFVVDHRPYLEMISIYPFLVAPSSEFAAQRKQAEADVELRVIQCLQACEDLGLKVCLGEQSIEYYSFNWVQTMALS